MKVTFDTNVADRVDLVEVALARGFEVFVTSVTNRELLPSNIVPVTKQLILETAVFDESSFGSAVLGSDKDAELFESTLWILSNGSFPRAGMRDRLTKGERRQLRDAMIFVAHVRQSHNIFVSDDKRAFVRNGRREKLLEEISNCRIMTSVEFISEFGNNALGIYCAEDKNKA
jgi:hypothetical protein